MLSGFVYALLFWFVVVHAVSPLLKIRTNFLSFAAIHIQALPTTSSAMKMNMTRKSFLVIVCFAFFFLLASLCEYSMRCGHIIENECESDDSDDHDDKRNGRMVRIRDEWDITYQHLKKKKKKNKRK